MPNRPDRQRIEELLRYGVVGVFNAASYLLVYSALVLLGVPYVLASILAFPPSLTLGYWLHEHWTFERGRPSWRGLSAFAVTQLSALVLGTLLLVGLVGGLGMDEIAGRIVATPIAVTFAYLVGRSWVFAGVHPSSSHSR